jgi:CBS domain-containing protein
VGTMIDQGINRRPVVDQAGKPLGVLARHDPLRAVAGPNQLPLA